MVVVVVAAVAVVMAAVVVVVAALLLTANISETSHTRWQNGENSQRRISAFQFNQIAGWLTIIARCLLVAIAFRWSLEGAGDSCQRGGTGTQTVPQKRTLRGHCADHGASGEDTGGVL